VAGGFTGINIVKSKPSTPNHSGSSTSALSIEAQAGFKRAEAALTASHFRTKLAMESNNNCAAHSYGQVRDYFQSNPCRHLARAYIQVGDIERSLILVAISWVEMPTSTSARDYKHLVDIPDTGNITELSRETKLFEHIAYDNAVYGSGIKGNFVWNIVVKPVFPTPADVMNQVISDARQQ
jgi:hypothetical protein